MNEEENELFQLALELLSHAKSEWEEEACQYDEDDEDYEYSQKRVKAAEWAKSFLILHRESWKP